MYVTRVHIDKIKIDTNELLFVCAFLTFCYCSIFEQSNIVDFSDDKRIKNASILYVEWVEFDIIIAWMIYYFARMTSNKIKLVCKHILRRFLAFELASLLRWKVLSCELVGFKYLMFAISSNSSGEWVLVGSCFEAPMYAIGSWHGTSDAMHGTCVIFWKYLKLSDQRLNKSLIESRSFTFFLS